VEHEGGKDLGVDQHFLGGEGELVHMQGVSQGGGADVGSAGRKGAGRRRRCEGLLSIMRRRRRRRRGVRHGVARLALSGEAN